MGFSEKMIASEEVYNGRIITVYKDTVELSEGGTSKREIVEHAGGVGVVAVDCDGYVYFVRQFRYAMGMELLEIPAGKLEDGEDPLECAVRELGEETGLIADTYIPLGEILPSPGYCKEVLYDYLALDLKHGNLHLDEGEYLSVEKIKFDDAVGMIMSGKIRDAKTVIGILKAKEYLKK